MPSKIVTKVNAVKLDELLLKFEHKLTPSQLERGKKVVNNLKRGAPSCQKTSLPACQASNADGVLKYGKEVTDTVYIFWPQVEVPPSTMSFYSMTQ